MSNKSNARKYQKNSTKNKNRDAAVGSASFDDVLKTFRILREKQPLYRGDIVAEIRADRIERYKHF